MSRGGNGHPRRSSSRSEKLLGGARGDGGFWARHGSHGRWSGGTEMKPGDLFYIAPGHDSWVVGDEPYVSLHFMGAGEYARHK
jgi:hypothetical protein